MTAFAVCGFQRSGAGMIMRMLVAGGIPAVETTAPTTTATMEGEVWFMNLTAAQMDHHVVNVLDSLLHTPLPTSDGLDWRLFHVERPLGDVARSQTKFLISAAPDIVAEHGEPDPRVLQRRIREDRTRLLIQARATGPVLTINFADALHDPLTVARSLRDWCMLDDDTFDVEAATATVRYRDAACAPDLALDAELVGQPGTVPYDPPA